MRGSVHARKGYAQCMNAQYVNGADCISLQQGTAKLGVKVCQCGSNGPAFFHILSVHSIIGRGVAEAFNPITAQRYPVALVACGLSSLY